MRVISAGQLLLFLYGLFISGTGLYLAQREGDVALTALGNGSLGEALPLLVFVVTLAAGSIVTFLLFLLVGVLRD